MTRRAQTLLVWLALLLVGLGPVGAAQVSGWLHAPLCACAGCTPEAGPARSCCEPAEAPSDGPALRSAPRPCRCVAPQDAPEPALPAPRALAAPDAPRAALPGVAAPALAACALAAPLARARSDTHRGPPGHDRTSGAARAAALGALLC